MSWSRAHLPRLASPSSLSGAARAPARRGPACTMCELRGGPRPWPRCPRAVAGVCSRRQTRDRDRDTISDTIGAAVIVVWLAYTAVLRSSISSVVSTSSPDARSRALLARGPRGGMSRSPRRARGPARHAGVLGKNCRRGYVLGLPACVFRSYPIVQTKNSMHDPADCHRADSGRTGSDLSGCVACCPRNRAAPETIAAGLIVSPSVS